MSYKSRSTAVIGELIAYAMIPVAAAFLWDHYLASWFGYEPAALCTILMPIVNIAGSIATVIITFGVIVYTISFFRSDAALTFIVGGVLLLLAPQILPHYLNANACVFTAPSGKLTTSGSNLTP